MINNLFKVHLWYSSVHEYLGIESPNNTLIVTDLPQWTCTCIVIFSITHIFLGVLQHEQQQHTT